jgi:WD40 repeat protein/DNA-binding SARP family transcriptional activator
MARLSICLLGSFQVTLDGEPVTGFESDKVRALLAYLALEADRPHRREALTGLLWPERPERAARTNLRRALTNLRQAIRDHQAEPPFLQITQQTIQFNPSSDHWLDVTAFTASVAADDAGQPAIDRLEDALALYRGSFLEGFSVSDSTTFEDWALLRQEWLQRQALTALRRLAGYYEQCGAYEQAVQHAWRQIALEPWEEEAHQQLMRLLALSGRRSEALAQYETCCRLLAEELGVEPAAGTTRLYEQIRDGTLKAPALEKLDEAPAKLDEAPAPGEPPFKGLQYFDQADANLFFGREMLTAKLVAHLAPTRGERFLAVVGASGSGKSSIVRAGLIPALVRGEPLADGSLPPAGSTGWPVHVITPTAHPLEALALSLTRDAESVTATTTLMDDLARDPRSLHLHVCRLLPQAVGQPANLLLVVDQFEELFTLCRSEAERQAFVDNLMAAVERDGPTVVVIALRADFYARCGQLAPLREALEKRQVYIGPMSAEELRRAVTEPAQQGGWAFEPGLVEFLLQEVGDEPGALPLLSHTLLETWRRRRGRALTFDSYRESGGVRGAIAQTADRVLQGLEPEQQAIARHIFLRLTELGEGAPDTRRRAKLAELVPRPEDAPAVEAVVRTLADARLITTSEDTAEVAHEVLIREWPTLRGWLDENRAELQLQRHLTEAAQAWAKLERDPGELYRGARLAHASEWAETHAGELNPLEREFLEASQELARRREAEREARRQRELEAAQKLAAAEKQRAEEQARAGRRLRWLAVGLGLFLLVALVSALLAFQQANRAGQQARQATARELAAAALNNLNVDPERSLLLALQAVTETYSVDQTVLPEAEDALHQAVQALRVQFTVLSTGGVAFSPDGTRLATTDLDGTAKIRDAATGQELLTLAGHTDDVMNLVFSPDGTRLATTSLDGTARIWDATTGKQLLTLRGHTDGLISPAFSPDGTRLVTTSYDRTARVWDVSSGEELLPLTHPTWTSGPDFSPDGTLVAIAGPDPDNAVFVARVWDVSTGEQVLTLAGHASDVNEVDFSPDGTRLATASTDGTAKVWDATTGEELLTLDGHTGWVFGVDFSPDGTRLATGGQDGTARLWDATTGRELLTLAGHAAGIGNVAFSPDGKRLITGSADGTAKVWDITPEGSREWLTLAGHTDVAFKVAYSPDGNRLVTASWDGTAKVWDAATGWEILTLAGHTAEVVGITFSPDSAYLATASYDGTARVWNAASGEELLTLDTGWVFDIAFSPDGTRLATGGADGTAKVWDISTALKAGAATGQELLTLPGHTDFVFRVAFSPDGTRLATASWDETVKLWDTATGQELVTLSGHTGEVNSVVFSPDGSRLATASTDSTAKVWDARTGEELFTLSGHAARVWDVAFSPDGTRLATMSFDGVAKLWDLEASEAAASGQELLTLHRHNDGPDLAFSPDGKHLATTSGDGTVRVYVLPIEELVALARTRLTRAWTVEECRKFLHLEQCPPAP